MFIEFKELAYSLVEGAGRYNVTIVRQGEPGGDIVVSIFQQPDPLNPDGAARRKRMAT